MRSKKAKTPARTSSFDAAGTLSDAELLEQTAGLEDQHVAREMTRLGYTSLGAGSFIRSPSFDE